MIVDLTKPDELPVEFTTRLRLIENICRNYEFFDELVEHRDVYALVRDINAFCATQRIIGIHYTRAVRASIIKDGVLIRTGEEIRSAFIKEYGYLFTELELDSIKERWRNYFTVSQSSVRDSRIFFNFTEMALENHGAEQLLGLYGGEQVSMCFDSSELIGQKLGQIGEPLIVRCALDPSAVRTFDDMSWGKILISAFHVMINKNAYGEDRDAYQTIPVKPEDIIEIKEMSGHCS